VTLTVRSVVVLVVAGVGGLGAFLWPLLARPDADFVPGSQTPLVLGALLVLILAVVGVELTSEGLDVRALAVLGVLAAIGAALRPLGTGTAGIELVFFLLILGGRVFGPGFGFTLGAVTLFASALLTGGVGPWLPHQMIAAGFVGLGAGLLPRAGRRWEIALLCGYGAVSAFAYGWLMDFAFWPFALGVHGELSWRPEATAADNLHRFVLFNVATSMGWNLGRAATNVALIAILGPGVLVVLRRAARRAAFLPERVYPR
jgi:energy-coupling factor transport system substrate-specific component